jgi:hypothetical protein
VLRYTLQCHKQSSQQDRRKNGIAIEDATWGVLKKLAADIRALSAGRRQTPSEDLLRESRNQR